MSVTFLIKFGYLFGYLVINYMLCFVLFLIQFILNYTQRFHMSIACQRFRLNAILIWTKQPWLRNVKSLELL